MFFTQILHVQFSSLIMVKFVYIMQTSNKLKIKMHKIQDTHTDHELYPLAMPLLILLNLGHIGYDSDHITRGVGGDTCKGLRVDGPAGGIALVLYPHVTFVCDAMNHTHLVQELKGSGY